jgi:hypothetical protein
MIKVSTLYLSKITLMSEKYSVLVVKSLKAAAVAEIVMNLKCHSKINLKLRLIIDEAQFQIFNF